MKVLNQGSVVRGPWRRGTAAAALLLVLGWSLNGADPLAALFADRAAVERVYYNHRTGAKPAFEEALPAEQLRRLVELDLAKETTLKRVYRLEVTPALIAAEVQRINTTTRAPEVLAELKAALGHDPARFARTVAKPIVVERLLRNRFENDDALHAPQRRQAEQLRERLLTDRSSRPEALSEGSENGNTGVSGVSNLVRLLKGAGIGQVMERTWILGARTPEREPGVADEHQIKERFGPEARVLSSPARNSEEQRFYFADLPAELQRVLRTQLRQPGDVSAVIETPGSFLLYVCTLKTAETLGAAALSLPKLRYDEWLQQEK